MTGLVNVFVETQFPNDVSYGSQGGPRFSTTIFTSASGREQRNINWSVQRCEYDVAQGIKTKDQMDAILAFFYAMMGKAYAFRFKDWADYQMVNQQIGTGDGTTTTFQFTNTYSDPLAVQTYTRTIKKPVTGTLGQVTIAGAPTTAYTMDYTTGLITFNTAPGAGQAIVVVYCEFDVPVRFDTDVAAVRHDFYLTESWESIKVVEVKL
jgi:uncharacterized protein (TIGR02217 family)